MKKMSLIDMIALKVGTNQYLLWNKARYVHFHDNSGIQNGY